MNTKQYNNLGLEYKLNPFQSATKNARKFTVSGYASLFEQADENNDVVARGAYAASLKEKRDKGVRIKMLWQHDPAQPIGVWETVREDEKGLFVKGYLLSDVPKAAEAAALLAAGALDGLSIGYRTKKAQRGAQGRRYLTQIDLWEVSLVTFPMLRTARVGMKDAPLPSDATLHDIARAFKNARAHIKTMHNTLENKG